MIDKSNLLRGYCDLQYSSHPWFVDQMQQAAVALPPINVDGHMKEHQQVISHDLFKLLRDHLKGDADNLQLLKA